MPGEGPATGALAAPQVAEGPARFWEIDLLRTLGIAMMLAYHAGYDVAALAPAVGPNPYDGGWRALQVLTGTTFLAVVGLSLAVSDGRSRARGLRAWRLYRRRAWRAGQVLGAAGVVSLVTYLALGDQFVRFGILHLIGVALLIAPWFVAMGAWNLPLGAALIGAGLAIRERSADVPGALVLGFRPRGEGGVDLYPLAPWLGVVLIGVSLGRALYPGGERGWSTRLLPERPPAPLRRLASAGRHSLPIYLVHQPILITLVALALLIAGVELQTGLWR